MATANPTIEDVELTEDQLLLGEEAEAGHASIIKNSNYKETKIKHQEEKGEKEKKKKVDESQSDRNDEDRIDQEDQRNDAHQDGGTDGTVRDTPLCCHNSTQNSERINRILRTTKRHRTLELSIKTISIACLLISTAVLSFNYGREKMANESKKDKTLKSPIPNGHQSSTLMKRIVEVSRKSLDDTELEEVAERQDDLDAETESGPEVKTNQDYQGHKGEDNGQGESDEIVFIEENSEVRDRGSTTSTTKKPRGVSFWPR